jgi:hypothetical protein
VSGNNTLLIDVNQGERLSRPQPERMACRWRAKLSEPLSRHRSSSQGLIELVH